MAGKSACEPGTKAAIQPLCVSPLTAIEQNSWNASSLSEISFVWTGSVRITSYGLATVTLADCHRTITVR